MVELDSRTHSKVDIKLFKNVRNVAELRQMLVSGDLKCSIVKPSLICDPLQIIVAANKAALAESTTTKSIYSEILFNLSISKNITNSLRTFGIDEKDKDILVVTIIGKEDEDQTELYKKISGEEVSLASLIELTDVKLIRKIYKIGEVEANSVPLLDSIVSRIATKDFLSH